MKYLAKLVYCYAEKNNFEKGCIGKTFDKTYPMEFEGNTLEEVKTKIKDFHGFDELYEEDNLYRYSIHENSEGQKASDQEFEKWKQGKIDLWDVETAYEIFKCEKI